MLEEETDGRRSKYHEQQKKRKKICREKKKKTQRKAYQRNRRPMGEVLSMNTKEENMLATWERKDFKEDIWRKIEEERWVRRTNQELYKEPNLVGVAKASRIRWISHVVRLPVGCEPDGKRRRGRPKPRWKKEVQEDIAKLRIRDTTQE
ncbi:hypothetical protein ILUMI_27146 [Ignelater luminosus]|uniref:Uncharacterized protein n=1 Tax=Ignelater luminosus TaxID=2038154 RepID=A0A8K0C761_IGNLU|nr:hypothetical protein ILUMI_27146 [Ignelater luminosus]